MGNPSLLSLSMLLPPTQGAVDSAIRRLRAESEASKSSLRRALLLHEIAELEERFADESAAARAELAAVNGAPQFREPLERLLTLVQQRHSHRNRSRLLERLVTVAGSTRERVRALLEKAAHYADTGDDLTLAKGALEQAREIAPDDSTVWFATELLAGQMNDQDLRGRALAERARLARHPTWKALLFIDYAGHAADAGTIDLALEALDQAIAQASAATALALSLKATLTRTEERWSALGDALQEQARLVERALHEPAVAQQFGLPSHTLRAGVAADLSTRAALAYELAGERARAAELLAHSSKSYPDDIGVLVAELRAAERRGDEGLSARLSKALLDRGATGPAAAVLWLELAEAHADAEPDVALDALGHALELDPDCSAARALELDLLGETGKLPRLARALESTAEQVTTKNAKLRFSLLAADVYARHCLDGVSARAVLSRCLEHGAPSGALAHLARSYATMTGDLPWFEQVSLELAGTDASDRERASLWFELARFYARANNASKTLAALNELARIPERAWLGTVLLAYFLEPAGAQPERALGRLSELVEDAELSRALRTAHALRLLRSQEVDEARAELRGLAETMLDDEVVASLLSELDRNAGDPAAAARTLERSAASQVDGSKSAAMYLEAALLWFRAGEREAALRVLEAAYALNEDCARALLKWTLTSVRPDDLAARARVLDLEQDSGSGVEALDRIALCLSRSDQAALDLPPEPENASDGLLAAYRLGSALWLAGRVESGALEAVVKELGTLGPAARTLGRAAMLKSVLAGTDFAGRDFRALEEAARGAADDAPCLATTLEWLSSLRLVLREDPKGPDARTTQTKEVEARRRLAAFLEPGPALEVQASALLAETIVSQERPALLEGDHPAIRLTNLDLALPGDDPARRASALSGLGPELGEESQFLARILAGYNQLGAGRADLALATFRDCADQHPKELVAWEGLRAAAVELSDAANEAYSCAALGSLVHDDALGAELWERAGILFADTFGDASEAEQAFSKAVDRDPTRHAAFDKLFRLVRARNAPKDLLRLIDRGLGVFDDPTEIAKLYWEQARALRSLRDSGGAWAALENVWMLEPDHVGALALAGELLISKGQFADAAGYLSRLARLPEAPAKQRLISGVAAADLYEHKLSNPEGALAVLLSLDDAGLSTLPIRERLAKVAARCKSWEHATRALEQLARERSESSGRVEAARLALVIYRDELHAPSRAENATRMLLAEVTDDVDALDLVLGGPFDPRTNAELLEGGRSALLTTLREEPIDPERLELLARVAEREGDPVLEQAALGAWTAVTGFFEETQRLEALSRAFPAMPEVRVEDGLLALVVDDEEHDATHDLLITLAPTISEILGPDLTALGVQKKHRVVPRQGLPVMSDVVAWAGALGLGEFELYVGGDDIHAVMVLGTEPAQIVLGDAVAAPLTPENRARLARELFAHRRGTSAVLRRSSAEVVALIVAACALGDHRIQAPAYAMLAEFERLLRGAMPRRVKKALPELAGAVAASEQDPALWVAAARRTLDRIAAVAVGDVSWALAQGGQRGTLENNESDGGERDLLRFVLSESYAKVRSALTTRLA